MLQSSIDSLFVLANNASNIEVILAMDDDDTTYADTFAYINAHPNRENIKLFKYPRYGYKNLHLYINDLCTKAAGKYYVLWNDDARMVTRDYDSLFQSYFSTQDKLFVYQFQNNHYCDIFPVVPREWIDLLGHFSLNAHNDSWIQQLAMAIGVNKQCEIQVWHLRGDDAQNAIYRVVDSDCKISSPEFESNENKERRATDIEALRRAFYT
jgi:hypothetical protein